MNRRPWFGITGRREAIRPYVDTSKSVLGARGRRSSVGAERESPLHLPPPSTAKVFERRPRPSFDESEEEVLRSKL